MRYITVGLRTPIRVPECWSVFSYKGWLYVKGKDDRWIIWGQAA